MTRPLVVCDVDEVILGFAQGLDRYLEERGLRLLRQSYALDGNVVDRESGAPIPIADVKRHVRDFQEDDVHTLPAIPDAKTALTTMAARVEIVFLTNVEERHRDRRQAHLEELGLPFPVIANSGVKGPALAELIGKHRKTHNHAPVAFLDDSPVHLASAAESAPEAILVHFVADDGFRSVASQSNHAGLLTGDWKAAKAYLMDAFDQYRTDHAS